MAKRKQVQPTVDALLSEASAVPDKPIYVPLSAYGEVICVLMEQKGMSAREVATWLMERLGGREYSVAQVYNARKEWALLHGKKQQS